jgi:CRISPR-associated endonuclease/helicase Cas3
MVNPTAADAADFRSFFHDATGFTPYEWQVRVATDGLPEVLPIPTGLGKTEGAALAWAWRRLRHPQEEPLHLVYCLPMRSLVRQTVERLRRYFDALVVARGEPRVSVYELMGGAIDDDWARWPDQSWVLVGTQDQLLSRALNRGYAMNRFEWPVHFGLLNQDCRWIVDEVQLMGPGLWATAQLDWMRRKRFSSVKPCLTTWMSATVGMAFLKTTDRTTDGLDSINPFEPRLGQDPNEEIQHRLAARRRIELFTPQASKKAPALHAQITSSVVVEHVPGTLSLVICNTVKLAQGIFDALPEQQPKILLTSRFRRGDRRQYEQQLMEFEERRSKAVRVDPELRGMMKGDPGLICVSTQVVEAGVDISAHRLWSEIAPWPSMVQRLGRLNRDGRDNGSDQPASALFWRTPRADEYRRDGAVWVGPYRKREIDDAGALLSDLIVPSASEPFVQAVRQLEETQGTLLRRVLEPAPAPLPRALDVHGLFSTERDVHGGFTDVSAFVRGSDPDADVTVFWRVWARNTPPRGDMLDGPAFDSDVEGCAVAVHRVRDVLKSRAASAWSWNDEDNSWDRCGADDLRPGMVVMLHRDVGGYDVRLGWTGDKMHRLADVPSAGPGRVLDDDERTEAGHWVKVNVHLRDARQEAEKICDSLELRADDDVLSPLRRAVVEAARLHDLGKTHQKWQSALPSGALAGAGPWAKCPRVVGVDFRPRATISSAAVEQLVEELRTSAFSLAPEVLRDRLRLRWAVDRKLSRVELEKLKQINGVVWAGHVPFRPGMRHEAASTLAMWHHYKNGKAPYSALAVYLVAAHHGKVRTVMRATSKRRDDVFGVGREPETIHLDGTNWPLNVAIATDGATGEWHRDGFVLSDHGWTGVVADLLGPWRNLADDQSEVGAVPEGEPRRLGPFVLAWLEALVRVADWRASERPSERVELKDVSRGQ